MEVKVSKSSERKVQSSGMTRTQITEETLSNPILFYDILIMKGKKKKKGKVRWQLVHWYKKVPNSNEEARFWPSFYSEESKNTSLRHRQITKVFRNHFTEQLKPHSY